MVAVFGNFSLARFWEESEFANRDYVEPPPSAELVASLEAELGFRLPREYVEFAQVQNGGTPRNTCHRTGARTSWAEDHVMITGIYAIGRTKTCSLGGGAGSKFWVEEWGYPPIGIYFADCPSAGHDMICLDYRDCGPEGEPRVVHIDQELDYRITIVAPNFQAFIRGLQHEDDFPFDFKF